MQRNLSTELYRCLMMLGICLLHGATIGSHLDIGYRPYWGNVFLSCVTAFVFISGYYGIRFRLSRFLQLWGIGLFYALFLSIGSRWLSLPAFPVYADGRSFIVLVRDLTFSQWFLNCYAALMLLSPVLNVAVEKSDRSQLKLIGSAIGGLVFIWGYLSEKLHGAFISPPHIDGMGNYTVIMMLGVYVEAQIFRRLSLNTLIRPRYWVGLLAISIPFTAVGLGGYASPFALLFSMASFSLVSRITVPPHWGKVISFIVPSLFPIILFDSRRMIILLKTYLFNETSLNHYVVYVLVGFFIFLYGVALDVFFRRSLATMISFVLRICNCAKGGTSHANVG